MVPPGDIDDLATAELRNLVVALLGKMADLQRRVSAQRDEIALEGDEGTAVDQAERDGAGGIGQVEAFRRSRGRGKKPLPRVAAEDHILAPNFSGEASVGARFKGYEDFVVQDLVIRPQVTRYRRERWLTVGGRTVIAPLPPGVRGHFGPELRRFVLLQYHQCQVTVPRLVEQLRSIGIAISKRQVLRLLNERQEEFLVEARDVLREGLASAPWLTVDAIGTVIPALFLFAQ